MRAFDIYVRPIIEYICFIWNIVLCMDTDIIENVQKYFTRRIFKKCSLPRILYVERLSVLNRASLKRCRLITSLTILNNIFHK